MAHLLLLSLVAPVTMRKRQLDSNAPCTYHLLGVQTNIIVLLGRHPTLNPLAFIALSAIGL